MLKRLQLLLFLCVGFYFHSNAQFFRNHEFADIESWGLVELVHFNTEVFQFKQRDSLVRKIEMVDVRFGTMFVWKYKNGHLYEFSQKEKGSGYDRSHKAIVHREGTQIDSIFISEDNSDWANTFRYSYDSIGRLEGVVYNYEHVEDPLDLDDAYSVTIKQRLDTVFILVSLSIPHNSYTILKKDLLVSAQLRKAAKNDSISADKQTHFRRDYGCPILPHSSSSYSSECYLAGSGPISLTPTCPDNLLSTQENHYKETKLQTVRFINPNGRIYTIYFEYNRKGLLSRIYGISNGKEDDFYRLKYKY
jgi:hypothetical protein